MDANSMSRKEFLVLSFTLIGSAVAGAAACSGSSNNADGGGSGGGSGGGTNGGGGAAGSTTTGLACADPLPETQNADQTGHTHTVTVPEATLNATTDQTFTTSPGGSDGHTHMVTLTVANLATIKAGGSVPSVPSTVTESHMHTYAVSCQAA
jgi:hypothetical protein